MGNGALATESIAGRYRVVARIASGGMGEVYRARDSVLGRTVAVKVLPPDLAARPGFIDRFRSEAQAAARLSHPNVVQVHDWGETESAYFMVMEYVRGKNLRDLLGSRGRLAPRQACEVMIQTLEALSAAHQNSLVHRDVKPENIMLTAEGHVKVMDFGIARALEREATAGLLGTVAYVSPEQARGGAVDGRSDLYSAGCVLYELLTGAMPFEGSAAEVLNHHLTSTVPNPSADVAGAASLDGIVRKAAAREPGDRYASAEEMKADLVRALDTLPTAPPLAELAAELTSEVPQELVETALSAPPKKSRRVLAVVVVVAAAAIAALVFAFRPVRVPEVAGLRELSARQRLLDAGLAAGSEYVFADDSPGEVARTEPEGGSLARRGTTVILYVSRGLEVVTLDNLIAMSREAAEARIKAAGLVVGTVSEKHDRSQPGTVLDQSPEAGKVTKGTPVNLTVSKGAEVASVPDVVGKTFDEARSILAGAGFDAAREETYSDLPSGTVVTQSPAGGEKAEKGSAVMLSVSKGPEPFAMPDVRGRSCAQAKSELEGVGLVVTYTSQSKGGCGSNKVLEQDPLPGSTVRKGQEATLYAS